MKKFASLLFALVLACTLVCAMAEEPATGEWAAVEVSQDGVSFNPADVGMSIVFVLNDDGSGTLSADYTGESVNTPITWNYGDGVLTIINGDQTLAFAYEGGKLTTDMGGATVVFSQDAPEAPELPAIVAVDSKDAIIGSWNLTSASVGSLVIPAEAIGAAASIEIDDTNCTLKFDSDTYASPYELVDGAIRAVDADGSETVIYMTDAGTLSTTFVTQDGEEVTMYFARVE